MKNLFLIAFLLISILVKSQPVGLPVGLSGSQLGVKYQLQLNGVNLGKPVVGTGLPISFGNQLKAGNYTVIATDTLTLAKSNMTGSATIIVYSGLIITENVTISQGEIYKSWTTSGQYTTKLINLACDSIIITNLLVK
jgi:hypothetical protein